MERIDTLAHLVLVDRATGTVTSHTIECIVDERDVTLRVLAPGGVVPPAVAHSIDPRVAQWCRYVFDHLQCQWNRVQGVTAPEVHAAIATTGGERATGTMGPGD